MRSSIYASGIRWIRDYGAEGGSISTGITTDPNTVQNRYHAKYIELCSNEYDGWGGNDWAKQLHSCLKLEGNALAKRFPGLPIIAPSLITIKHFQQFHDEVGDLKQYGGMHIANVHWGMCGDNPGPGRYRGWQEVVRDAHIAAPDIWVTETGYGTWDPNKHGLPGPNPYGNGCAISNDVSAAYIPRSIMYLRSLGISKVFFYQGADVPIDSHFGAMGLFNSDGSPKPQAVAVMNMIRLYSDPGGENFVPDGNAATVTADAPSVMYRTDEKRDRTKIVAVWNETLGYAWDAFRGHAAHSYIAVPPAHATVKLDGYHPVAMFEEMRDGALIRTPFSSNTVIIDSIYPRWVIEQPNS